MNYTRIALAAVAATIVDLAYGFVVYGMLLTSSFALYPNVYRSADTQMTYMPALAIGVLVAMLAASMIYAKGYEGGRGATEGARFGFLIGIFAIGYATIINYATLELGRRHTLKMAAAALGEWILAGVVIGLIYKPASTAARQTARA